MNIHAQIKLKARGIECQHVIMTAVDIETFTPAKSNSELRKELTFGDPSGGFLCVYVGRISREKRIDIIAEAVTSIEGAYLAIIGELKKGYCFSLIRDELDDTLPVRNLPVTNASLLDHFIF
jgi:glycosyltransferase involved in cell wall biosynthesis